MRCVLILGICSVLCIRSLCQHPQSNIVSINVPQDAISLSKEEAARTIHANFKRSSIPLGKENYYKVDGIIVSFWDHEENAIHENTLEEIRSGMLGILKRTHDTVNISKIIKINDMQFLVYEFQNENEVHLVFQTDYYKNANFGGMIEFKKPDEEKAQKILQELLQSIHFKAK
jgi:hypothetical protein